MANPEHLALLKQGVEAWNQWRQAGSYIEPDLKQADLRQANLGQANLGQANLRGADLHGANLVKADLRQADLRQANLGQANLGQANLHRAHLYKANLYWANLHWADLRQANLHGADLYKADLSKANLNDADFNWTDLRGANLYRADLCKAALYMASLGETILSNINLAEVRGLDTCRHEGPSTLDFPTLQQSGPLPLAFLRGCGLPNLLIDYLPSLLNQPIQYYSCFISYSSKDEDFAQRLHADLQSKGVRCWFAPEDIQGGRKIYEQLGEAIRLHEKLLLVLSEHSMSSKWVRVEIDKARQREEREKRQVLFPLRLVDYETIEQWECFSAHEIREYFIPDFSNWKSHDAYQAVFDRLLRDLKPELERKPES